jgi:hypothetical protein
MFTEVSRPSTAALQYFFWRHPEWWTRALYGLAWATMLLHGWQQAGHNIHHSMSFPQELTYWLLMVAAMMLPLILSHVWVTAAGSLWPRRHRAIAGFLVGYFAPWLLLGTVEAGLRQVSWTRNYIVPALLFGAAAAWQLTSIYRRAMLGCHRTQPLAPAGWLADRDCLTFGGAIGIAYIRSCWPLMFACALAGHGPIAMTGSMAVTALERWPLRPQSHAPLLGTLTLACYYAVLAFLPIF